MDTFIEGYACPLNSAETPIHDEEPFFPVTCTVVFSLPPILAILVRDPRLRRALLFRARLMRPLTRVRPLTRDRVTAFAASLLQRSASLFMVVH